MNQKELWLATHLESDSALSEEEQFLIGLLKDDLSHEDDVSGAIDTLATLLSLEALYPLLNLLKDSARSRRTCQHAARAIQAIGSDYLETELAKLRESDSSNLRNLATIALTPPNRKSKEAEANQE